MDIRILELAVRLTDKAMGAPQASANWIGSEDKTVKFLNSTAEALNRLFMDDANPSHRR